MIHRILYATDFSDASHAAFAKAIEFGQITGAELIVMHALPQVTVLLGEATYISPETWNDITAGARAEALTRIEDLVLAAGKAGVKATSLLVDGVAADQIVRAAKDESADLLVLGTHGRTGLSKVFLGSVATRVVATAPCPVLTVRGA